MNEYDKENSGFCILDVHLTQCTELTSWNEYFLEENGPTIKLISFILTWHCDAWTCDALLVVYAV